MKKKEKSAGGGANWMDTYGDMVTLLLCFFVLLYSMSSISEESWKALVMSFNPLADQTITVTPGGDGPDADADEQGGQTIIPDSELVAKQQEIDITIEELFQAIQQMVSDEGMSSSIQVTMEGGKVYVRFSDTVFFDGDSYVLKARARDVLAKVCAILDNAADAIDEIRIQGHTAQAMANRRNPAEGDRFLASNRATIVTLFLQEHSSIHPARIISEGYGQWRPISSNATAESRAPNRRVEMIITGRKLDAEALNDALSQYITQSDEDMNVQDQ